MTRPSMKPAHAVSSIFKENMLRVADANQAFRRVVFTGDRMQLVVMSLPPGGDTGPETHERVEQLLFCLQGEGGVVLDDVRLRFRKGDVVVVPPGVRHNIAEHTGIRWLDLFTVYAPPNHLPGRVHETKEDAEADAEDAAFDAGAQERVGPSLANLSYELLYGADHKLGLPVPRGGSSCTSCQWVRPEGDGPHCASRLWQLWPRNRGGGGGKSRLPVNDAATFCCDLWSAAPSIAERRRAYVARLMGELGWTRSRAERVAAQSGMFVDAAPVKRERTVGLLRKLLAAAEAHGEESGIEHEAGDLRDLLTACWNRLTPEQRREVYAEHQTTGDP